MTRILVPSRGTQDWQRLLADPAKQWRRGYSARTLASAWEQAGGPPSEIRRLLARAELPSLRATAPLLVVPEYTVDLPGGRRPSQTDVFVLGRAGTGLVVIAVEGKVHEDFGPLFDDWYAHPSAGKTTRWRFITDSLGLDGISARGLRYQLFHRLASAVVEARRFGAEDAIMLIHSFARGPDDHFADYESFVELFGRRARRGQLLQLESRSPIRLHAGWAVGNRRFLSA